jgi:hypothetical protein
MIAVWTEYEWCICPGAIGDEYDPEPAGIVVMYGSEASMSYWLVW